MKQLVMPVLVIVPLTIGALWVATGGQKPTNAALAEVEGIRFIAPMECSDPLACVVQNHVDLVSGPEAVDAACGARTYNDHQGVDFRILDLPTMLEGVPVRAVADGVVMGTRDGEYDGAWLAKGREAIGGRDCGNGVGIRHEDGYTTQVCHLRRGSVLVKEGDAVTQGQIIGNVGMSGLAEFPHVHLSVNRESDELDANGNPRVQRLDPFTGRAIGDGCGEGKPLWAGTVPAHWQADAGPFIFKSGFTDAPVTVAMIERKPADPTRESKAIVFYARTVAVKEGDIEKIELTGPEGFTSVGNVGEPLANDKAQTMMFVGRPAKDGPLPLGEYTGRYQIERDGQPVLDISRSFVIR